MRNINTYVCVVDYGKPVNSRHNTAGRYYVGAKDSKEASKILKQIIKLGSIQIIDKNQDGITCAYKQIKQTIKYDPKTKKYIPCSTE